MTTASDSARERLEQQIWELTEWRGSAQLVDQLLTAADQYATAVSAAALRVERRQPAPVKKAAPAAAQERVKEAESDTVRPPMISDRVASTEPSPWPEASAGRAEDGKVCRECEVWKPWPEFHVDRSRIDGRRSRCRDCCNRAMREKKRKPAVATL
jgi:hypothetical protein